MIMADNKKKLTHAVTIMQGETEATFRLTDKEYNALLEKCLAWHNGLCYKNAIFVWANHDISRSKCKRFYSIFNYHNGDFYIAIEY